MSRHFVWFLLLMTLTPAPGARAQTGVSYAPVLLHVACGEVFAPPCAKVLPRIGTRTAQAGLDLKPVETGGVLDAAGAVCAGQAAAAIVARDAIARYAREPACVGRYDIVGPSLYPVYALLVVRAGAPFRRLDDLTRDGRRAVIAVADEGSAGRVLLAFLSRSSPALQNGVAVTEDDFPAAAQRIADGSIDGFLTMAALADDFIDRVRQAADARGRPLYRFVDLLPPPEFFRAGDGTGHCIYRVAALDFGGAEPVTTISTDAVLMLGRVFRDAHARGGPRAADALASAIEAAQPAILADMRSPGDWRTAATTCQ